MKFFDNLRGYGFVIPDSGGRDVFCHAGAVRRAGLHELREGDRIKFDTKPSAKGAEVAHIEFIETSL